MPFSCFLSCCNKADSTPPQSFAPTPISNTSISPMMSYIQTQIPGNNINANRAPGLPIPVTTKVIPPTNRSVREANELAVDIMRNFHQSPRFGTRPNLGPERGTFSRGNRNVLPSLPIIAPESLLNPTISPIGVQGNHALSVPKNIYKSPTLTPLKTPDLEPDVDMEPFVALSPVEETEEKTNVLEQEEEEESSYDRGRFSQPEDETEGEILSIMKSIVYTEGKKSITSSIVNFFSGKKK